MRLGYNTNGLAHHTLLDAIELIAAFGYQSVAISIDHHALSPRDPQWPEQLDAVGSVLRQTGLHSVIETGARFLLNPVEKHEPTLVSPDGDARAVRIAFLQHAIDIAAALGSDCVSLWSGVVRDDVDDSTVWNRLEESMAEVLEYADTRDVPIGFEPEPGMFIDTMDRFEELADYLDSPRLQLTLDIGHLHVLGETPIATQICRWSDRLANIHIEDMRAGVHEHLMFGDGEIDFAPVIAAIAKISYRGGLHVELSRHSHIGPQAALQAMEFLGPLVG